MGQPYVGEIRIFAGNFAPAGWMFCEGQLLPISENETLFQLIGITYGGDGRSTFALPDLRGRLPLHQGNGYTLAERGGVEEVTLTANQIPLHSHAFLADSSVPDVTNPVGARPATPTPSVFAASGTSTAMSASSIGSTGGSQPHSNMQPYLCVNFIISLFGIFPTPN